MSKCVHCLPEKEFRQENQSSIEVLGKIRHGVLEVPRYIIDMLEHSDAHHRHVRVYVQEGEGAVRPWKFQDASRKRLARTRAVRTVAKRLKEM